MPGIVGVIGQSPPDPSDNSVWSMLESMRHESTYVSGTYSDSQLGISCGWISHPDSFSARQVFADSERGTALILSGECFPDSNARDLLRGRRKQITWEGGDWLLPLYAESGPTFFEKLNGLFSGLLIDRVQRKAFLFNDRYGLERIYWHQTNKGFYFASEAKALLRVLPELRELDNQGLSDLLRFGCTRGTSTLFRGVETLPPASVWTFEGARSSRQKYFSLTEWESQSVIEESAFNEELEETLKRILPRYFEVTTRIGISLTAGLDGRMIMSCLPETTPRPICYTFAGEATELLDARLAARIATAVGLEHRVIRIEPDFFSNFGSIADRTVYLTDGSLGVLGSHELYLNQQARALAPIRVTGVFGGEILRDVSFSRPLNLDRELFNSEWRNSLNRSDTDRVIHPVSSAISREIPERRFGVISSGRSQTVFRTPYLDNELVALAYRIPPALRGSVKPAISVIRNNQPALSRIPTDMGLLGAQNGTLTAANRVFGRISFKLDYFYDAGLPNSLAPFDGVLRGLKVAGFLGRHKFLHYRNWFKTELATFISDRVEHIAAQGPDLWSPDYLRKAISEHFEGKRNRTQEISLVLTLDAVQRLLLRDMTPEKSRCSSPVLREQPMRAGN